MHILNFRGLLHRPQVAQPLQKLEDSKKKKKDNKNLSLTGLFHRKIVPIN